MSADLERLVVNSEYGEISNFNNKYYVINNDKKSLKKFDKKIINSYIALPSSLLKFHNISLKTKEDFLKFRILKNFKDINKIFSKSFKLNKFIEVANPFKLNTDEKKIINIFKKINLLPLPIFLNLSKNQKNNKIIFSVNKVFENLHKSKILFNNKTQLPLKNNKNVKIYLFDDLVMNITHYALVFNNIEKKTNPIVRVHSSCLTGDLMGSQKCDCGYQLSTAIDYMSKSKKLGILIYLNQEGRGLGIHNKIISYNIQEKGYDTYEADNILGFSGDERNYDAAVNILKYFKISNINLITNNPEKIEYLKKNRINVSKILQIKPGVNKFNKNYLLTKKNIGKHLLKF